MNKLNKKGISLIVLVVTVIVLSILASAVIISLSDTDIIEKANESTNNYNQAQGAHEESLIAASYYLESKKGTYDGKYDEYVLEKKWNLKIGDVVNYDCVTGVDESLLTYTQDVQLTSANSVRKFSAVDANNYGITWRVLGVENGKILLVSDVTSVSSLGVEYATDSPKDMHSTLNTPLNGGIVLYGENGYINAYNVMNKACAIYGHGKGAISARPLNMDDIDELVGYVPNDEKWEKGELWEYNTDVEVTMGTDSTGAYIEAKNKSNGVTQKLYDISVFKYFNEQTNQFESLEQNEKVTVKNTYYGYKLDRFVDNDSVEYNMVFDTTGWNVYWTPNRAFLVDFTDVPDSSNEKMGYYRYNVVQIAYKEVKSYTIVYSDGSTIQTHAGFRVVVELDWNTQFEKQSDGTYNIL